MSVRRPDGGEPVTHGFRLFVAFVVALTVVGGALTLGVLTHEARGDEPRSQPRTVPQATAVLGRPFGTSFGVLAVERVETIAGLTAKDLAGVTHGIQGLVGVDRMQVQVAVQFTNGRDHPVRYRPEQFRLRVGRSGRALPPSASSIRRGTLQPEAGIRATFAFVAPRSRARLWLEFRDPGQARPVRIDLGRADARRSAPAEGGVSPTHDH